MPKDQLLPAQQLKIWLFGSFQIWRGDVRIDASLSGQPRNLLALFLTERNQFIPSERLIEYFWSHLPIQAAANNLQVAIRSLRLWLEPDLKRARESRFVITEPDGYRFLAAGCYLDVDEFTQLVQRGQTALRANNLPLAQSSFEWARQIYRGELLAEFPYHEWSLLPRERLRETHLQMLEDLAETFSRVDMYEPMIAVSQQALSIDPLAESFYRHLMRAHAAREGLGDALDVYTQCETRLREELDVEPSAETRKLRDALQAGEIPISSAQAVPQSAFVLPLVGRNDQLAALRQAWQSKEKVVLIAGEAGSGKTRLVEEWVNSLNVNALKSRALENDLPFAAPLGLVQDYLVRRPSLDQLRRLGLFGAALSKYVPSLRDLWHDCPPYVPLPGSAERERLHHAILVALRLAAEEGTVFVIDDLQWVGEDSLSILADLVQQPLANSLLILSYRSDAAATNELFAKWLTEIQHADSVIEIKVPRLAAEDLLEGFRAATGLPDPHQFVVQLHQATGGHPLFVTEVLRGLIDAGDLYRDRGGAWHVRTDQTLTNVAHLPRSQTLRDAILSRAVGMSSMERETLDAAAVLQRRVSAKTLAHMLRTESSQIENILHLMMRRGLLVQSTEALGWEFSHILICEAIYDSNPHARLMHHLAAHALVAEHRPVASPIASEIVEHFQRGGGDVLTAPWAVCAGQWAWQNFASLQACQYFETAKDALERQSAATRDAVLMLQALEGLANAQRDSSQFQDSLTNFEKTLSLATVPKDRIRILQSMAQICARDIGQPDRALALLDDAEGILAHANISNAETINTLRVRRSEALYALGRFAEGADIARRIFGETREGALANDAFRALHLNLAGQGLSNRESEFPVGMNLKFYQAAEASGDLRTLAMEAAMLARDHASHSRFHEALQFADQARTLFRELKDKRQESEVELRTGIIMSELGELVRAEEAFQRALTLAQDVGAPATEAAAYHRIGRMKSLRGHSDEAGSHFEKALAIAQAVQAREAEVHTHVHYAQALWLKGDMIAAQRYAQRALDLATEVNNGYGNRESRLLIGALSLAHGDLDSAATCAREALEFCVTSRQPRAIGCAERLLGQVAAARKKFADATTHFDESERLFREIGAQIELGLTLLARSRAYIARGAKRADFELWLLEARRLFRRTGALPYLKQVEKELKQ